MKTLILKIQSVSSSKVARYSIILALAELVNAGLVRPSYLTRYINKNTSRSCALAHVRKHAKFASKLVSSNGIVNRYEVYLQFTSGWKEFTEEGFSAEDELVEQMIELGVEDDARAKEACLNHHLPSNATELDAKVDADKRAIHANTKSYFAKPCENKLIDEEALLQREDYANVKRSLFAKADPSSTDGMSSCPLCDLELRPGQPCPHCKQEDIDMLLSQQAGGLY